MSSWKAVQSKKQIVKKTKWALIVLALVLGLIIFGKAVKFTQTLFTPWQPAHTHQRNYRWNTDFNINILMRAKNVSLFSYNPQRQKMTIIDIPNQTYLEVAHGFGKWMIASVYNLGESQPEYGGGKLLKDTLVNFFGVPIDGYMDFSSKYSRSQTSTIISEIRKNPFSAISILPYLKTDLTPFELIRLKMGLSSLRFDKIKQINLERGNLLQEEKLADGTDILTSDSVRLDSIFSEDVDPAFQSEHKTIAVFNSTDHPQLAQRATRLITNIGGNVIITSNGQNKLKKTQISGEKSKTLERLKQIFDAGDTIDTALEDLVSSRAQINLFLGEDYFELNL